MPSVHDVRSNGIPLSMDAVTFVDLLRDAGYRTALVGKSHLQNFTGYDPIIKRPPPREGFHEPSAGAAPVAARSSRRSEIRAGDAALLDQARRARADAVLRLRSCDAGSQLTATRPAPTTTAGSTRAIQRPRTLLGPKNSLPHDYSVPQAYRTAIPEELYATAFLGERACAYLDEADDDAPFFLMVSFPDPHHPFNPPGKYWDMYKPEQFPVPEAFTRNDWTPPALVQNIIKERETGKANLTGMGTIGVSAREAQEASALTCGMIACVDDAIGAVLGALDRSGKRDDTVVIFTSDHGDHLGDHRLMLKGAEQYQSIVRVPFIWSDPQAKAQPQAHRCAGLDHGHRRDRARTRQDRAGERHAGEEPAAGAGRQGACATRCSSSTTTRRRAPAPTCRCGCIR